MLRLTILCVLAGVSLTWLTLALASPWTDTQTTSGTITALAPELTRKVIFIQGINSEARCADGDGLGLDEMRDNIRDTALSMQNNFAEEVFSDDDFLQFSYGDPTACGNDFQQASYEKSATCIGIVAAAGKLDDMVSTLPDGTVVDIIGHSLGGMVAAYWVSTQEREFLDTRVHAVITLDSPMRGANLRGRAQLLVQWFRSLFETEAELCPGDSQSWRDIKKEDPEAVNRFTDPQNSTEQEAFAAVNCTPVPIGDVLPGYWRVSLHVGRHDCAFTSQGALTEIATTLFTTLIDDQRSATKDILEPSPSYSDNGAWSPQFGLDQSIKRAVTVTRSVQASIHVHFEGGEIALLYGGFTVSRLAPSIKVTVDDDVVLDNFNTGCRPVVSFPSPAVCTETLKAGLGPGMHHLKLEIVQEGRRYDFRFDAFEVMPVRR